MKYLAILLLLSSCSNLNDKFFDGEVVGPIVLRAGGLMECATVVADDDARVCKCHIKSDSMVHDKCYLTTTAEWCDDTIKFTND